MPQSPLPDPNRVKIRIAFSGNGRDTTIDIDSANGCKVEIKGQLWPDDVLLVAAMLKLVNDAKTTYKAV